MPAVFSAIRVPLCLDPAVHVSQRHLLSSGGRGNQLRLVTLMAFRFSSLVHFFLLCLSLALSKHLRTHAYMYTHTHTHYFKCTHAHPSPTHPFTHAHAKLSFLCLPFTYFPIGSEVRSVNICTSFNFLLDVTF